MSEDENVHLDPEKDEPPVRSALLFHRLIRPTARAVVAQELKGVDARIAALEVRLQGMLASHIVEGHPGASAITAGEQDSSPSDALPAEPLAQVEVPYEDLVELIEILETQRDTDPEELIRDFALERDYPILVLHRELVRSRQELERRWRYGEQAASSRRHTRKQ